VNELRIAAVLQAREALRYTPAGIPVSEAVFRHGGTVTEAGTVRSLDFEFGAVALGPVALGLDREPLGQTVALTGFLAPRSRRSQRLRLHITDYTRQ
jgi:primosomal replication protein N